MKTKLLLMKTITLITILIPATCNSNNVNIDHNFEALKYQYFIEFLNGNTKKTFNEYRIEKNTSTIVLEKLNQISSQSYGKPFSINASTKDLEKISSGISIIDTKVINPLKKELIKTLNGINESKKKLSDTKGTIKNDIDYHENGFVVLTSTALQTKSAISNLLFSTYYYNGLDPELKKFNIKTFNESCEDKKNEKDFKPKDKYLDDFDVILSQVNCYEIPKPNIVEIAKIFCKSELFYKNSDSNSKEIQFCNDLDDENILLNSSNNSYLVLKKIISYFPEYTVYNYQQKYRIGKLYYPIIDTNSIVVVPEKRRDSKNQKKIIFKNLLRENHVQLENSIANCLKKYIDNNLKNCVKKKKYFEDGDTDTIKLTLNNHLYKDINWKKCLIGDLSLLKLFKGDDGIKLYPVYKLNCSSTNNVINMKFYIDAKYGTIYSNIEETIQIINSNEQSSKVKKTNSQDSKKPKEQLISRHIIEENINSKKKKPTNEYILFNMDETDINTPDNQQIVFTHVDRVIRLFQAVFKNIGNRKILHDPIKIKLTKESCSTTVGNSIAGGNSITNLLCLGVDSKNNNYSFSDKSIISHEVGHILIPKIIKYINNSNNSNSQMEQYTNNLIYSLSNLFHDTSDAMAIIYSNDKNIENNNCIGQIVREKKCDDNVWSELPRLIADKDSLSNNIPMRFKSDYKRGEITAKMFNIALVIELSITDNKIIAYTKHWIRYLRSIAIYNYSKVPCNNCDKDFYNGQQNLMRSYALQLIGTNDEKHLNNLFYNLSLEGYTNINSKCLTSQNHSLGFCSISSKNQEVNKSKNYYHGLALAQIVKTNGNNVKINLKTGVNYYLNSQNHLINSNINQCNKHIEISFFNKKGELVLDKTIQIGESDNHINCLYKCNLNPNEYKKLIESNKIEDIQYKVFTRSESDINGATNNWFSNQINSTIIINTN